MRQSLKVAVEKIDLLLAEVGSLKKMIIPVGTDSPPSIQPTPPSIQATPPQPMSFLSDTSQEIEFYIPVKK